jgi:hypothetical protein
MGNGISRYEIQEGRTDYQFSNITETGIPDAAHDSSLPGGQSTSSSSAASSFSNWRSKINKQTRILRRHSLKPDFSNLHGVFNPI